MRNRRDGKPAQPHACTGANPPFVPEIDFEDIFRKIIEEEVRSGRLTRARRKRIVQYATRLRMSARQVGRMIEACRQEALESSAPTEPHRLLRLVEPRPARVPFVFKLSLIIALVILFDALLLKWIY